MIDSRVDLRDRNIVILKDYGAKIKLVHCSSVRKKGYEVPKKSNRGEINSTKLDESISRTKGKIFELAYCNPWEYFITLTINPLKYSRNDLKAYYRDFSQWLRDYGKKHNIKVKYMFIPEMHEDGNWHMHGFIYGLPESHLTVNKYGYLDWIPYKDKFGFCSIDKIRNQEAIAKYITKYITKDLSKSVTELNANMYYRSQGLNEAREIKRGTLVDYNIPWDYENDYVKVKWLQPELTDYIINKIDK